MFMTGTRLGAWLFPFIDDQHPLAHQPWCHHPYGSGQQGRGCPSCLILQAARCSQFAASSGLMPLWGGSAPSLPGQVLRCYRQSWRSSSTVGLASCRALSPRPSPGVCGGDICRAGEQEAAGPMSHQFRLFPRQRCPSVRPGPTPPGPGRRNLPAARGSRC